MALIESHYNYYDNNFFNKISISLVVYYLLRTRLPPVIATSVLALMTMASIYNTPAWAWLMRKVTPLATQSRDVRNTELLATLKQLSLYEQRTRQWNSGKRAAAKALTWNQQSMLDKIGYNARINKVDAAIKTNAKLITEVINYTKRQNKLTFMDMAIPVTNPGDNYRVIEALCHFQRDWSSLGDVEIGPILEYIRMQTQGVEREKTIVVVPGSGLGRVAHEWAMMGFAQVCSVEFSMVMRLFNEFVYSPKTAYTVYPFVHGYSNQVDAKGQLRNFEFETLGARPENLQITYGDFNKFEIHESQQYDNIIISTVFFMDTAENLFQYLETINKLTKGFKGQKLWINAGPLKYGTRPKVELNLQELTKLAKLMGWTVIDEQKPQLLGYLTDLESMWQGQYGVSMFTCKK